MKLYEYMVIYSGKGGIGRVCITLKKEVETYKDVEELDKIVSEHNDLELFVMDFKLLRTYKK